MPARESSQVLRISKSKHLPGKSPKTCLPACRAEEDTACAGSKKSAAIPHFREIFGGKKGLSKSFAVALRWLVGEPVECYQQGKYVKEHDILDDVTFARLKADALRARNAYWHLGVPCSSLSLLNVNCKGGTRRPDMPQGDGSLESA